MTTLVLPRPAPPQWNWPRVGALSGTFSLHLFAVALLLVPPAAVKLLRATDEQKIVVTLFDPPPKPKEIPVEPVPSVKLKQPPLPKPPPVATPARAESPVDMPSETAEPPAAPPGPATGTVPPVDTPPVALAYLTRTPLPYPKDALQRHEQGIVILRVLVGADGLPQTVEVEKSSGSRSLDLAARSAVARWTFTPGTVDGVRSALWARVPIAFSLQLL